MDYRVRLNNLERAIESARLDAIVITHLPNIHYLCGFTGSSGVLAFAQGAWAFFTDGRYTQQAKQQVTGASIRVSALPPLTHAARWLGARIRRSRSRFRIGIEPDYATLTMESRIDSELKAVLPKSRYRIVPARGLVEQLRVRKDLREVEQIRAAAALASGVFPRIVDRISAEATENGIAAELEYLARQAGAEKMSFESIVASGSRSALPHARPTHKRLERGFVVLDYGVILGGYCSDMTRTICVGPVKKEARRVYSAVLEAQLAAIVCVRAGVAAQDVDAAARKVLRRHKLDKYFTHSLGHGVGIEIHESPRLAKGQTQKLEPGMVVTIEPGVYIPESGGVRIEDMVLVTQNNCEVLTPTPKDLINR